jgi:hypothetical protein
MAENLVQGLLEEMNRCRELIKEYEGIGSSGAFAIAAIKLDIQAGENALGGGDVVEMLDAFKRLKGCR